MVSVGSDVWAVALQRGCRALLLGGASSLALLGTQAKAAAPAAGAVASTEEIVVTARRRAETVLKVPYNISAVSGGAIESKSLTTPNELLRTVPGVSVVDRGPRNAGQLDGARIRGINVDSAALGDYPVSSVSPLSTYINDTPVFANFLLKDLDRVEVLRGPQATLYGSGSLGGTVRYIQNEPDVNRFSGKVTSTQSYTANSDGAGWSGDLTLNVPLSSTLAVRGTVSRVYDPGFIDYPNLYKPGADGLQQTLNGASAPTASDYYRQNSVNDQRTWYGHGALLWRPTDALKLVFNYNYQDDHVGGRQAITEGTNGFGTPYGRYENGAVIKEPSAREVNVESLEATYDLGFATLTSSTSYYDHRGESITDNTGFYGHLLPTLPVGFLYYFTYYAPNRLPLTTFVNTYSERAVVEEARLASNSKPGALFDYVIGFYYEDQDRGAGSRNYLPGFEETYLQTPEADPTFVSGDRSFFYQRADRFRDVAGFGELTWHVSQKFDVTGGLRYFSDKSDVNATIGGAVLTRNNIYATNATHVSEDKPLGKVNLSYRLDDDNLAYATVAQGYRRGGSNAIPITGPQKEDASYLNYTSDSTVNYEIGVKGRTHGITYSLAAFYIDWSDVQVNIQTPTFGYYAVVNGKSAASRGVEAELSGKFTPSLAWTLGYAYTDASLTSDIITAHSQFNDTPYVAGLKGTMLPGVPEHTLNVSLNQTQMLGAGIRMTNRVVGYYQSSTRNGVTPGSQNVGLDPFSLWTLSSTLQWRSYEATLFVKNLFNAKAATGEFTQAFSGSDVAANFYGNDARTQIATPTTAGLTLSYRF
ncbi:TonB-dependent receptor [Phenylobacterium montanum]|uniref:TonB-dependent receptor n=1 Tax=Phenylobacterium montanum TaxID=2823693 RepID=A0A975FVZ0_9CAUL|nr:TonB-dependent receptor [Caulobacter sp. S6]QUD85957.1 TonB-dependent receptor [Caulobacter sp. S6]